MEIKSLRAISPHCDELIIFGVIKTSNRVCNWKSKKKIVSWRQNNYFPMKKKEQEKQHACTHKCLSSPEIMQIFNGKREREKLMGNVINRVDFEKCEKFYPINFWLNRKIIKNKVWHDDDDVNVSEMYVNTHHRTEELIVERSKCEQGFIWYKKEIIHVRPVPKNWLYHTKSNCWIKHTKKNESTYLRYQDPTNKNWFISTSTARTF